MKPISHHYRPILHRTGIFIVACIRLIFVQKEMHLCAAKCCDDSNASMDVVQGCIDRCSQPVNRAQQYVQKELGDYQGRLQRCVMVTKCDSTFFNSAPPRPLRQQLQICHNFLFQLHVSFIRMLPAM